MLRNSFFDIENWREIGATLARNKTRTFLTAFGIFWGTAMLTMLWGGAHGLEGIMRRQFAGFATNSGGVFPGTTSMPYLGYNKGMSWDLTEQDLANIRRVSPYMEYSTPINGARVTAVYNDRSKSAYSMGVESEYSKIMIPIVYEGRLINDSDVRNHRKVAIIGKNIAGEIFGNESPVGKRVSLNGIHFLIVGVAGQKGDASFGGRIDDSFMLPSTTMRRAFNQGTTVHYIIFTSLPGHTPKDNEPFIRRAICSNHPLNPKDERAIGFMDVSENFEIVDKLFLGLSLLALFVGAGSLMAGVIGVGNIMWIIVKERTQEIGIRRAIGAKPLDIIVQILSESIVLTTISGIGGVCFATLVLGIADMVAADPKHGMPGFQTDFNTAIAILATFLVLGTAAGLLPAFKAMKIKPVEAMRDK